MERMQCRECQKEYERAAEVCPHCGASQPEGIPQYPTFKGPAVFIVMWVFFVILILVFIISLLTN